MTGLLLFMAMTSGAAVQNVDFRNFTYPIPQGKLFVPGDLKWIPTSPPSTSPWWTEATTSRRKVPHPARLSLSMRFVNGDLTMGNQLDALVVLNYHTGGTAWWSYLYAFSLASERPRLLGWLQTGSRADSGLYHLFVNNGGFTIDVFDPDKRTGDCCSAGFMRTSYEWKDGKFIQAGPRRYGRVEKDPTPR